MKKLATISGIILLVCLLFVAACQNDSETNTPTAATGETYLIHARPYIVVRETNWTTEDPIRNTMSWQITSEDASSFEEYAQTAVKAVLDLYKLYESDFSSVTLIPAAGVYVPYSHASFAADGKGNAGMTGSAPSKEWYWNIKSADQTLTETELSIAELWAAKMHDFPSKNPISSLSYDEVALRQYIAEALNIPYDEIQMPTLKMTEYELEQSFIDWTISAYGKSEDK